MAMNGVGCRATARI
ncbi:hypothetical protein FSH76_022715, partial [Escherichia coli]|nr:hypothetical protein [Escherichia coli]